MKKLLAIETSTPVCSAALKLGDQVYEERTTGRGQHSEKLFLFIDKLLNDHNLKMNDLDAVLISAGPGSYTGLRIGASAVKGLLFGQDAELWGLNSLISFVSGLSGESSGDATVHAVIDAKRVHLYHQKAVRKDGKWNFEEQAVRELEEIDSELKTGNSVIGTGHERLKKFGDSGIQFYGEDRISAKNLLNAWENDQFRKYFIQARPEDFDPEYLTFGQVNNLS